MALQNNHLLGSLGTLVPQVLGRAGPEGISAPKAMGGGGLCFLPTALPALLRADPRWGLGPARGNQ